MTSGLVSGTLLTLLMSLFTPFEWKLPCFLLFLREGDRAREILDLISSDVLKFKSRSFNLQRFPHYARL